MSDDSLVVAVEFSSKADSADAVIAALKERANPDQSKNLSRFFKTGPGQYGEGDVFLGVMVPHTREVAKQFRDLDLADIDELVRSPFHEARLCALVIVTNRFTRAKTDAERAELFAFYLSIARDGFVNNWDLVDVTAPKMGDYLVTTLDNPMALLTELARDTSLWLRRVSVLFTFAFLRVGNVQPTIQIVSMHLNDPEDLMHKASGWALREVGKRDDEALRAFLTEHAHRMPRTMLRYAIEKLPEPQRQGWLSY